MQNLQKKKCYFEAIFKGWDEKFCLSKSRTTEGPRTREARTREAILYQQRQHWRFQWTKLC